MKRWALFSNGQFVGSLAATVDEIEQEYGLEGRDWYRRHGDALADEVLILRRPKRQRSKTATRT